MSILSLSACLLAILFFMAGCLHIGLYVGATSTESFSAFFPGLVAAAWPLAVAALLFALLDIRLALLGRAAKEEPEDDDILEAPMSTSAPKSGSLTYFAVQPETIQPAAAEATAAEPPADEGEGQPLSAEKDKADDQGDLSFFKLQ